MATINKLTDVRTALSDWLDNNEQISKRVDGDKSLTEGTICQRAATIDIKYPELAAIIHKHDISTGEYVLANCVLTEAFILVTQKNQDEIPDYPEARAREPR